MDTPLTFNIGPYYKPSFHPNPNSLCVFLANSTETPQNAKERLFKDIVNVFIHGFKSEEVLRHFGRDPEDEAGYYASSSGYGADCGGRLFRTYVRCEYDYKRIAETMKVFHDQTKILALLQIQDFALAAVVKRYL